MSKSTRMAGQMNQSQVGASVSEGVRKCLVQLGQRMMDHLNMDRPPHSGGASKLHSDLSPASGAVSAALQALKPKAGGMAPSQVPPAPKTFCPGVGAWGGNRMPSAPDFSSTWKWTSKASAFVGLSHRDSNDGLELPVVHRP